MMLDDRLFPSYVRTHAMTFDPERDGVGPRPLDVVLPAALGRAVPKRRAEFAAGRRCAREALRALAPELVTDVAIGIHREPMFPAGAVGTISHARAIAAAAVAPSTHAAGIGLDIEYWVTAAELAALDEQVLVQGEAPALEAQTGWTHARVATFVFSAKETLYKCLFPTVQTYFDFQDAEIISIAPSEQRFEVRLRVPLAGGFLAGETFVGRFAIADDHVVTALVHEVRGPR
ncbi:MAG: 4'-phosphopantetheinyl transferase superfamily protein [Kofleriaceae bacterium]|nr:4'-phosphopantetheinyl transferase superfamily protein [Kofleriaceae bacterium]